MPLLPPEAIAGLRLAAAAVREDSIHILRQHATPDGKGGQRVTYYRVGATETRQRVSINGNPTSGTFTLNGASIPYNATRFQLWDAIRAVFPDVPKYGPSLRTEGGPLPEIAIDVIFSGSNSGVNVAQMTSSSVGLNGGIAPTASVETITSGVTATSTACKIGPLGYGLEKRLADKLTSVTPQLITTDHELILLESDRLEDINSGRVFDVRALIKNGVSAVMLKIACDEVK